MLSDHKNVKSAAQMYTKLMVLTVLKWILQTLKVRSLIGFNHTKDHVASLICAGNQS